MTGSEPMLRILLLGDARQVHLVRWAAYLAECGHAVHVVSLEPTGEIQQAPSDRISVAGFWPDFLRYPSAVPALRRIANWFCPDIVNAHFLPNYGVMAALLDRTPWVLSTWGSDIMLLPQRSPFHMARTRWVIARATAITSDAEVMSRRLIELGANPSRVTTFPYGVDRAAFRPCMSTSGSRTGPRVLTNRKLEDVYDIPTVLEAFAATQGRLQSASLTVAGDGRLRAPLERAARARPGSEHVAFVGSVSHGDMPELLRRHDIYVSMARSDTTSVSLLEAMACGLFPVVSDIPANREWIRDGHNGLLVPVGDVAGLAGAFERAWQTCSEPALRAQIVAVNQAIIERRADWFKNMRVVTDLFYRTVGLPRGSEPA